MREVPRLHQTEGSLGARMMVMVSNNGTKSVHAMANAHPGRIGWLMGPTVWKNPWPHIPYALDNDAFTAWRTGIAWNESLWLGMLDRAAKNDCKPIWCLVPDVVADRDATLRSWKRYNGIVAQYGWQRAFAVQDGMEPQDVPASADVVFVGGTTDWKWSRVGMWAKHFPRVHVGRVRQTKLLLCETLGVESVDGTGWFRESQYGKPAQYLKAWLEGHIKPHPEFHWT